MGKRQENRIRIKLKSFDHILIDKSVNDIIRNVKMTGAVVKGPIPLPTKRTVYTVIRSPHIDKHSREQFELKIHKRIIDIYEITQQTIEQLRKIELPAGVDIKIEY